MLNTSGLEKGEKMIFNEVNFNENKELFLELLSENFKKDPLYVYIFKDERLRKKCLHIFFTAYLSYLEPSSKFYLSKDLKACGVVFLSDHKELKICEISRVIKMIFSMFPLIRKIGFFDYLKCLMTLYVMSSKWIEDLKIYPYAHMDLMVVSKEVRRKGYFKSWLDFILANFSKDHRITLETQSIENVNIYRKCGFQVLIEIPLKEGLLVQYGMVYEKKIKNNPETT